MPGQIPNDAQGQASGAGETLTVEGMEAHLEAPTGGASTEPSQTGATNNTPSTAPPADQSAHWSASMPEALQELGQGFASVDEAKAALARGKDYQPAAKVDDIVITLPEGARVNQEAQNSFKQFCVENGITAKQAQSLATWQMQVDTEATTAYRVASEQQLRTEWGMRYDENVQQALVALTRIDRKMGGTLAPELKATGMDNNPAMIRALYTIAGMMAEDTVNSTDANPASSKPEKPIDAFSGVFK